MEVKNGYKQTDFGVIPMDWEVIKLGDLFEFRNGLNKEKKYFGYGTPIINYMDVFRSRGIYSRQIHGKVFLSRSEINAFHAKIGDLFFTRTSETVDEIGISSVLLDDSIDTVFSGFVLRGREKLVKLNLEFKKYCFTEKSIRNQIISTASYTTRALTNGRLLSQILIKVPPLSEQAAIANALSDMDALISQTEKLIEKKKSIKQGAMQELLKPKAGWVTKKLGDVIGYQNGKALEQYFNSSDGYKVISIGNYSETGNYVDNSCYISREFKSTIKKYLLNKDELTMILNDKTSVGNIIGKVLLIDKNEEYVFNQRTMRIIPNISILPKFLYFILNSELTHKQIILKAKPGTQIYINTNDVLDIELRMPKNTKDQSLISEILTDMDTDLDIINKKLTKLKQQKQGMMQALLTGKIRLV